MIRPASRWRAHRALAVVFAAGVALYAVTALPFVALPLLAAHRSARHRDGATCRAQPLDQD